MGSLDSVLFELHQQAMIRHAGIICTWRDGPERNEQAIIHVRAALLENSTGRITEATRYRIYSLLNFVLPDDAPFTHEPTPDSVLMQDAENELAFQALHELPPTCQEAVMNREEEPVVSLNQRLSFE